MQEKAQEQIFLLCLPVASCLCESKYELLETPKVLL